ncbi:MAG TPA: hypothetical protein ENN80_08515, partial [Candidatus Hydrogenedentes bacterium]|nr:hypothetical protein [Candidatus Hydrogenedentota bacterium]
MMIERKMGLLLVSLLYACAAQGMSASKVSDATGVSGGLAVLVGADASLACALGEHEAFGVHVLDADVATVDAARERIRDAGLYGRVSAEHLSGAGLPYVDNLVSLLVAEDLGSVSMDEVMRVLCPNGAAYVKKDGAWKKSVKPRPEGMDDWTHYLYDATGNAVGYDTLVGPPRRLQWVGSPRWTRHHEHMSSMSALVSANGRIFYIVDEGSTSSIHLPAKWKLIARDAFNGTVLWKRSIPAWFTRLWPLKSGPAQLPRRLVAVGDTVYVTLGLDAPLSALDAITGDTLRTYESTKATEEIIASDGTLFLLVCNDLPSHDDYVQTDPVCWTEKGLVGRERPWNEQPRHVVALDAATGDVRWRTEQRVAPLTLAADSKRVYFHDGDRVVALDRSSGERLWTSNPIGRRVPLALCFAPTLVVYGDAVLFSAGLKDTTAVSASTGEELWTSDRPRTGHCCPEDILVADGLAWMAPIAGGHQSGEFTGRDPLTGEIKRTFVPDVDTYWFHHRCHRAKGAGRFLLTSRTGIEFVDVEREHWAPNHWVRGSCVYGVMPCNGLLYAPPHPCACYMESKLNGFYALAPEGDRAQADGERLETGPAFGVPIDAGESASDWPTYRHDAARSGATGATVSERLTPSWRASLGGKLSSVVVAGGRVFVAEVDAHAVCALDADSGVVLWRYTAGGRVDSPPTIHEGRALFGSADG